MTRYHCYHCDGTRDCLLEVEDGSDRVMHIPQPCSEEPRACPAVVGIQPAAQQENTSSREE